MNNKLLIGIFIILCLVLTPNVLAANLTLTHGQVLTNQGSASEGEGAGFVVYNNTFIINAIRPVGDTSGQVCIQNAARTSNLTCGAFNSTNQAVLNYWANNTNGTAGTQYFFYTNSNASSRTTFGKNPGVVYPITTSSSNFSWRNAILNDNVNTGALFGIQNVTIDDNPTTVTTQNILSFITPTPDNNTINYYTNNSINITFNSTTTGNVSITFYYFNLSVYNQTNFTNINQSSILLTSIPIGNYTYNATWNNNTHTNSTDTRLFIVYNITAPTITNPTNASNIDLILNINWTAASTNTTVNINNYTVHVLNRNNSLNRTLGTVTNLSYWGYMVLNNALLKGNYSLVVTASDSKNNKVNSSFIYFSVPIDSQLNITAFGWNGTQITTFNITFNGLSYNTTNGVISLGTVTNTNYSLVIDAVGYALNVSNYTTNTSAYQFINYSLQANQSMNITIYNIATGLPITTQNFTVIVTTTTFRNYTATNGQLYISGLDEGSNEIRAFNSLFAETVLTKTVESRSTQSVSIYLSATNTSNNVTLIYQDVNGVPILNMYVTQSVLFNSSYTLMMDGYTDINGRVYFVYDPLYYYLYNNSLTGYSPVPFYLTPPREASYTITVPFSSTYASYLTLNVTGISAYNNASNTIQFNYTSTDSTISNYSYSVSKIINSQPVIICSDSSTTYPTNTFSCNVLGYTGLVYVQGVANGNRIFYGEWIDLGGRAKLFDNINSKNSNYLAGILMLIIVFMGLLFGVWVTLMMGVVGILFIYFIGLSSAITLSMIGITILVTIIISLKLKRY